MSKEKILTAAIWTGTITGATVIASKIIKRGKRKSFEKFLEDNPRGIFKTPDGETVKIFGICKGVISYAVTDDPEIRVCDFSEFISSYNITDDFTNLEVCED